jgi:DNA polymerase elongation subunit (family B)
MFRESGLILSPMHESILEAATPEQEAALITDLCALIRERDPDTIENHNLLAFDLPFLEHRANVLGVPLISWA